MIKPNFSIQKIAKERVLHNEKELQGNSKTAYRSTIKGIGSMIIQNGLYGTLLFLRSKSKEHHCAILKDIKYYLEETKLVKENTKNIDELITLLENSENLSIIQNRVLEFVNWYRRYVEIFIPTK